MSRKESEAVLEGNGPTPQDAGKMVTWEEKRQAVSKMWGKALREYKENLRSMDQRLASLEHDARQPRPAMEADVQSDKNTREHTEGAATAVQAVHEDSVFASRVDPDPMCSTIFGVKVDPPVLPWRDDVLVENGAVAPKPCLSPLEMRTTTAAGDLLPTGKTSTATRTTFDQPTLWFCLSDETYLRTSTQSASYDSSLWRSNLLAAPSCRRVVEPKSGQKLMFDPGGAKGRLRACPFLGTWRELLLGNVHTRALKEAATFLSRRMTWASTCKRGTCKLFMPYV